MNTEYLAAIDCGTNSFHLIVVRLKENGTFEIADREREVIRLGLSHNIDIKIIQPDAFTRAINCLKRFKIIAQSYNAPIRAVATSAIRETSNREEFIEKVFEETGIDVEVVSGYEEARLIYTGVLQAIPVFDKKVLCIDIGGGSTELIVGYKGRALYSNSLKLGAVRLSQKFFPNYELTKNSVQRCSDWIAGELYPVIQEVKKRDYEICIGTSGTIMSTALMIQAKRKGTTSSTAILNNFTFTAREFESILEKILKNPTEKERKKIPGLDEGRADIIPSGMLILANIIKQLEIPELMVSGFALREGIILDSISKLNMKETGLSDIRLESILNTAGKFEYDKNHANHVSKLALKLFDDLLSLHKLDSSNKDYLKAAAILHDAGYHISHSGHHKHSYYIIKNSELLGFNEREIEIIAHTARYHRKSHPKQSHYEFNLLSDRDKNIIMKLSALLRVADSLDRTHCSLVKDLDAEIVDKEVHLKIYYSKSYPEIEIWNLERRMGLFEELFNKKILIFVISV